MAEKEATELNLNLEDRRLKLTLELAKELIDTPRHLSQRPGGFERLRARKEKPTVEG